MKAPAVSVVMTVFNGGTFLRPAIDSILGQTWADWELVVVDDGSTDGSREVLESFASADPRIRIFLNPTNVGQTPCLNQAIREARGKWIARQDADDLSLPHRIEAQVRAAERDGLVLVGTNGWIISERGAFAGLLNAPLSDSGIRWGLLLLNPFIHTSVLFLREAGGGVVQYDERFRICQDWDLWARCSRFGPVANLPGRLVCYRFRENSLSHQASERTREECRAIVESVWGHAFPDVPLLPGEAAVLERFREGLEPDDVAGFRQLLARMKWLWQGSGKPSPDPQAEAVHWFHAGGSLARKSKPAALAATLRTFAADPAWAARAVLDRVRGIPK